jgi:plasmid stabilization system protein ParE
MDYQVKVSFSARRDLQDIVRYISIDAPDRASKFGLFLMSKTKILAHHPLAGRVVPEFEDEAIREIVVRLYRVVYRVDHIKRQVEIIRFWHTRRDFLVM